MLEGFNDLTQFADIELREDKKSPYKPWNDLKKISYSGRLITNIFAAGTVDTERGHVTGMTDFGNLRHDIWSYARYFSDQGYITDGSHPSNDWFYNRKTSTVIWDLTTTISWKPLCQHHRRRNRQGQCAHARDLQPASRGHGTWKTGVLL